MVYNVPVALELTGKQISPLIHGHFIEFIENCMTGGVYDPGSPSSDAKGVRQDVLEKAKGLAPTILRWPGGTFANTYHWMDGIGPAENRRKRKNLIWGGIIDNQFGTAEFVQYCRALGAEPMLCVNMASGTAQEAAEWVEYCNGEPGTCFADLRVSDGYPEPFGVKYWCIGNESNAEPDLGAQHVPERYISDAWEFTKHMKLMDPDLKLVFVGDLRDPAWNKKILDSLGPVCDFFSLHHYSGEGGRGEYGPFASLRDFRQGLDAFLPTLRGFSMRNEPFNKWYRFPRRQDDIRIALDEWNIWNSAQRTEDNRFGVKTVYTWKDALWTACMVNTLANYAPDIGIANLAQMVNVLAPIMTDGDAVWTQTTYPVLAEYRQNLEGELVRCVCDVPAKNRGAAGEIPLLDAAACRTEDGEIRLFLVSTDREDQIRVTLPQSMRILRAVRLSAPDFDGTNGPGRDIVVRTEQEGDGNGLLLEPGSVYTATLRNMEEEND